MMHLYKHFGSQKFGGEGKGKGEKSLVRETRQNEPFGSRGEFSGESN